MRSIHKRVMYGAIAAAFAAFIALDASLGKPSNYPLYHKLFDGDWDIARNLGYGIGAVGAAFFGYLAVNVKNGNGGHTDAR